MRSNSEPPRSHQNGILVINTPACLTIDRDANQQEVRGNRLLAAGLMVVTVVFALFLGLDLFRALLFGGSSVGLGFLKFKFSMDRNQIDRICLSRGQGFEIRRQGVFSTRQPERGGDLSTLSSVFCSSAWEGGGCEGPRVQVWKLVIQAEKTYTMKWGLDEETCAALAREINRWLASQR